MTTVDVFASQFDDVNYSCLDTVRFIFDNDQWVINMVNIGLPYAESHVFIKSIRNAQNAHARHTLGHVTITPITPITPVAPTNMYGQAQHIRSFGFANKKTFKLEFVFTVVGTQRYTLSNVIVNDPVANNVKILHYSIDNTGYESLDAIGFLIKSSTVGGGKNVACRWVSQRRKVTLQNGNTRTLYKNSVTGELRVRTFVTRKGRRSIAYVGYT